ncbi:MAG: 4-hydroxy-3-methylbut-2-enyl diphosphate reductase [Tannerella sp.]|jgi:4-hydroxy-3-methylbut-2-enyl diphosphate reductase|nr:4-hydroxy-3-methylbut-2-enyl diphosphate reductase [Tannerella sp.]
MADVTIDSESGFCFGVVNAIQSAERELNQIPELYCLGDLVHNTLEMERLKSLGLRTIGHEELVNIRNSTVLLRAHGEPPSTYQLAHQNNIKIIDATCPVVLRLQHRIHHCYNDNKDSQIQLIIYGKKGHAEVNGLVGQTNGSAIVIENPGDLENIDFAKDIMLFSQTTRSLDGFRKIVDAIDHRITPGVRFQYFDTICRQAANRLPQIQQFASCHDRIYFVAGEKSSNGKMLYEECKKANPNTVFITHSSEIDAPLPSGIKTIGVCGATSTPKWLMEDVAERLKNIFLSTCLD